MILSRESSVSFMTFLKQEIADRLAVETKLQKLTQKLEQSVEQRTSQLSQALQNFQQAQVTLV